ncbi:hypothetical protein MMAR_4538 [Mycobacterium marinum M]|uniref:Uncharacterized protein n=1 Tax=Mycobacterium marinum (strain ATCC BAA-535 / M) TaxID=216594 RepID=B2HEB9_MYCMM|nr:hypothetical protein MMAR_4538 [Mycobacterium marinum M]
MLYGNGNGGAGGTGASAGTGGTRWQRRPTLRRIRHTRVAGVPRRCHHKSPSPRGRVAGSQDP